MAAKFFEPKLENELKRFKMQFYTLLSIFLAFAGNIFDQMLIFLIHLLYIPSLLLEISGYFEEKALFKAFSMISLLADDNGPDTPFNFLPYPSLPNLGIVLKALAFCGFPYCF